MNKHTNFNKSNGNLSNILKKNNAKFQCDETLTFSNINYKINPENNSSFEINSSENHPSQGDEHKTYLKDSMDINTTSQSKQSDFSYSAEEKCKVYPEYVNRKNAKVINKTLKKEVKKLRWRLFGLILTFGLSLALDIIIRINPQLLSFIPFNFSTLYLGITSFLFFFSSLICFKIIKTAFKDILNSRFLAETSIILQLISTGTLCIYSLVYSNLYPVSFLSNTFVSLYILNLIFIVLNLLTVKKRILKNLKFAISFKQKYNVNIYALNSILPNIDKKKNLFFSYQYKTNFLTDFIKSSYALITPDIINSQFIPGTMMFSILCFIINLFLTKNLTLALIALNISSLICIPTTLVFISNSIVSSLCKYTFKNNVMVTGENGIKKLSRVNSFILSDSDLYPPDNVVLREIKTFNGQRIDEAILSAAAIICSLGAPISHVFNKIIMGKRTILTKASDIVYKDKKGVTGWVNGQQVLIGNRELLKEYKIDPPSRDYEKKYRLPNCELTYFAIGRDLVAMFILEYKPSKFFYDSLYSCIKNNIKFFIKSVDCNISPQKISNDFNINEKNIVLLSYEETKLLDNFLDQPPLKAKTIVSTFGDYPSLLKAICACITAKNNINFAISIKVFELFFSILLVSTLTFCFGLSELYNIELVLYSLSWFLLTMFFSKIKRFK